MSGNRAGSVHADAPARVPDAVLDDLRTRVRASRRVAVVPGGWSRGADPGLLTDLLHHWAERYDWRAAEDRIRALPWVRTASGIRVIHQRTDDPAAPAVVLLHGWPDSFLRFERVLPLLDDLHVVVPCLPGYPGSDAPGSSREAMAEPIAAAMAELGHARYTVAGGDIGTAVAESMARQARERVASLHLTDVPLLHAAAVPAAERTDEERAHIETVQRWQQAEGAYAAEQATKPATLAVALGDSPAGLLAWIVEKLRSWSDCGGDVESVWSRDELLTWVTLYWVTGAIGTSFTPYADRPPVRPGRVEVPTLIAQFPKDLVRAPRSLAERVFEVHGWEQHEAGGHFAAWEQPEAYAASLRRAVALGQPGGADPQPTR